MNQVLKVKRKIHYLINMTFYLLFFIIGYLVGGGHIEKIFDLLNNIF